MENQKNQQLVEENDQKARFCNIIIHGVVESTSENNNDAKISDEGFFTSLLETIGVAVTVKSVSRIGKLDRAKKRPIKVYLGSEVGKINIMKNLKNLKGNELYKGINIRRLYGGRTRNDKKNVRRNQNKKFAGASQFKMRR